MHFHDSSNLLSNHNWDKWNADSHRDFDFTFLGTHVAPILSLPSTQTVRALSTLTFTVSATDTSTPAPVLTISGSQLPTGASFSGASGIAPSGTFTSTPSQAQTGTFTVTFTVTDGVTPIQ